jgi:uncharacterized protein (TIGR03437 family)
MRQLYPQVKPGAHILFLNDPVDDDYRLLFLARLNYRDMSILVQRMQGSHPAKPEEIAQADYVLDYRRGLFFNSRQAGEQGPQPAIEFEWGQPLVYREGDFHRITRSSPAKAGEMIIARVTDLGSTEPPVPAGQPFPQDPLLPVAAPVSVRIGGDTTGVGLKIGWPGAVNSYRIDFPLPADAHGDVSIRVIAGGVVGPPVVIPVQ